MNNYLKKIIQGAKKKMKCTWYSVPLMALGFNAETVLRRLRHVYFLGTVRTGSCK